MRKAIFLESARYFIIFTGKGGRGRYSYEVHMSYVEAFDDLIQDLFNAQNSDLVVADDPVDGPYVRGAVSVG